MGQGNETKEKLYFHYSLPTARGMQHIVYQIENFLRKKHLLEECIRFFSRNENNEKKKVALIRVHFINLSSLILASSNRELCSKERNISINKRMLHVLFNSSPAKKNGTAKRRIEVARSKLFEFISLIFGRNRERKSTQYVWSDQSLTSFRGRSQKCERRKRRKRREASKEEKERETKGEGREGGGVVAPQIEILLARGIIYRGHGPLSRGRESLRTNVCHVTSYTLCHAKFRTATAILPAPRLNYPPPTIPPFLSLSYGEGAERERNFSSSASSFFFFRVENTSFSSINVHLFPCSTID